MASASLVFAAMHMASILTFGNPGVTSVPADSLVPITVRLRGMVGEVPFECGKSYPGVGTTRATITASDFRFYVHNVKLVRAGGDTVTARMQPLAPWQDGNRHAPLLPG